MFNMRKIRFINGEFYHIYNRGADKRVVFTNNDDFERFLQSVEEFNSIEPIGSIYQNSFNKAQLNQLRRPTSKLVDIVCYCLNPNHYHMVLQQNVDGGISEFMKRLNGGYTKHFNFKHKRNGVLFQGRYKYIHINSNDYLLYISAYVNLNNKVHKLKGDFFRSSWDEFVGNRNTKICKKNIILNQFKGKNEYKIFSKETLENMRVQKDLLKELEVLGNFNNLDVGRLSGGYE